MPEEPYNPSPVGNPSVLARRNWWQTKLVIFIGKHTPRCREMVRILSKSMDEPMPLRMRVKKRIHYLICCWCQRYEQQLLYMRKTASAFAEHADAASTVPVPDETKERWKEALRDADVTTRTAAVARVSERRASWAWFIVLAATAAVIVFTFVFAWMKPTRPAVSFADYREEMVSFVKVAPNLEMRSKQLSELMDYLDKARAPSRFAIPEKVRTMEPAGCRILRFHGHDVTLICFWRKDGRLLHLFVTDRGAFPQLPERERAEFFAQQGWITAAWNEGDHAYLMAVQGDQPLLKGFLSKI